MEVCEGHLSAQQLILGILGELTLCDANCILRSPGRVVRICKLENDSWRVGPFLVSGFEKPECSWGISDAVVEKSPIDLVCHRIRVVYVVRKPVGSFRKFQLCQSASRKQSCDAILFQTNLETSLVWRSWVRCDPKVATSINREASNIMQREARGSIRRVSRCAVTRNLRWPKRASWQ